MSAARGPTCCRGYTGVNIADAAVIRLLGFLDHHDRVGAFGHRRAGRDLDALAGRQRAATAPARCRPSRCSEGLRASYRPAPNVSSRDDRVAVHRRAIERRDIARAETTSPASTRLLGVAERHALGAVDRDGRRRQQRACLFERDRLADRPHRRHRSSSRTTWPISGRISFVEREPDGLFGAGKREDRGAADRARRMARLIIAADPICS